MSDTRSVQLVSRVWSKKGPALKKPTHEADWRSVHNKRLHWDFLSKALQVPCTYIIYQCNYVHPCKNLA